MTARIKKLIAGFVEWITGQRAGAVVPAATPLPAAAPPSVARNKGGRPRKWQSRAERDRDYRRRRKMRDETRFDARDKTYKTGDETRDETTSSFSSFKKIDDDGHGDDARARADRIVTDIEKIVKGDGHWPRGGWCRAVLVEQILKRLRLGSSRFDFRSARNSTPPSGCTDGAPFFTHRTCKRPRPRSTISHRSVRTSAGRSPCRNATRIIVISRCPYRPRFRAVPTSSSTSLTVRYSRGLRLTFTTRRGGPVPFTADPRRQSRAHRTRSRP
jgi:hypothetical protein